VTQAEDAAFGIWGPLKIGQLSTMFKNTLDTAETRSGSKKLFRSVC
jgi:hypothetical protein